MKIDIFKSLKKLYEFYKLKDNWDSYGALAISKENIQRAEEFIKDIDAYFKNFGYVIIAPLLESNGDICIEVCNPCKNTNTIEINFLKNKNFTVYRFPPRNGDTSKCKSFIDINQEKVFDLIQQIIDAGKD